MSKRKLQSFNRFYGEGGDLLDVAWRAARRGAMTWDDARAVQDTLMPDCVGCGTTHGGKILLEKQGYCQACFRIEITKRMEGK